MPPDTLPVFNPSIPPLAPVRFRHCRASVADPDPAAEPVLAHGAPETGSHPAYVRTAVPVADWPVAWQAEAARLAAPERQAVGRLLAFAGDRSPEIAADPFRPDVLEAFAAWRARRVTPWTVRGDLANLFGAALKLFAETDWLWLKNQASVWYQLARTADGRPVGKPGGKPHTLGVGPEDWPPAHRSAFEAAFSPGTSGRFAEFPDDPGPLHRTSTGFRKGLERAYGLFLGSTRRAGLPETVTPASVQGWIDELRARNVRPRSIAAYVERLDRIVGIVDPAGAPDWLTLTRDRLIALAALAPKKKDGRHVDPVLLWCIGAALIRSARQGRRERDEVAVRFRNGLILMFLSSIPVRLANIASIDIGRDLILPEDTPGTLHFAARKTKGRRPSRYALWPELRAMIDEYIALYRPVLAGNHESAALWLNERGLGRLGPAGLYKAVVEVTGAFEDELGGPVNPHLFRDAVATALIERHPGQPEYAMTMLQHRHPDTTKEYQEAARCIDAALHLSEILTDRRKSFEADA